MMELLQQVFRASGKAIDYETQKTLAASRQADDRRRLAESTSARPEVLYYLAADADAAVRQAVAGNEATPVQADLLLARDRALAVRVDLAQKIARLAPGLGREGHERLRKMTQEVLDLLLRDQEVRVRQVIAEALKDVVDAPPDVIRRLAHDEAIAVAAPVLECSPLLTDDELLELIGDHPIPGALTAIARRRSVDPPVADGIAAASDVEAVTALLANPSAQIREETLDRLVDRAPGIAAWHKPLVERPLLSPGMARKLASFVADHLLRRLSERRDLDPVAARDVAAVVKRRLAEEGAAPAAPASPPSVDEVLARARRLQQQGQLDEAAVLAACAERPRLCARGARRAGGVAARGGRSRACRAQPERGDGPCLEMRVGDARGVEGADAARADSPKRRLEAAPRWRLSAQPRGHAMAARLLSRHGRARLSEGRATEKRHLSSVVCPLSDGYLRSISTRRFLGSRTPGAVGTGGWRSPT